jgi:hypothetical protein
MRLKADPKESEDFLGISGDSRSPCASFGAKIQLAYLIGLITDDDAAVLRLIKNIRNNFAHRVKADFNSDEIIPLMLKLNEQFRAQSNRFFVSGFLTGHLHGQDPIKRHLRSCPEAGAGLLLAVFTVYQAYLHLLSTKICRIDDCLKCSPKIGPVA